MTDKAHRILLLLIAAMVVTPVFFSCIGQKEDPEETVVPEEDPEDGSMDSGTRFFRRTLALDFTASWCQYCPEMTLALKEAKQERPGRLVEICIHQNDEMGCKASDAVVKEFKVSAWPSMVFDLDHSTKFSEHSSGKMISYVDSKTGDAPGVSVFSSIEGSTLSGEIRFTPAEDGEYCVGAVLVEDGIVASQMGAGENYVNNAVLREILLGEDIFGESVGKVSKGEEKVKSFTSKTVSPKADLRIVAYVMLKVDSKTTVINAEQCPAGEDKGYRYEKD